MNSYRVFKFRMEKKWVYCIAPRRVVYTHMLKTLKDRFGDDRITELTPLC